MSAVRLHPFRPLLLCLATACAVAQDPDPAVAARVRALHDAGPSAPIALHAVRVLEKPSRQVAEVLGLVLEKKGLTGLDVADDAFDPGDAAWIDVPKAFGSHVAAAARTDAKTPARHHLYAEILGTPKTGPTEVRFVVVDAAGEVVIVDHQTKEDADFRRTAQKDPDPLGCAALVGTRLLKLADWSPPAPKGEGKFAKLWREKSGTPDAAELAAMRARQKTLSDGLVKAKFAVLPTLWGEGGDADSAARLATAFASQLGCAAAVAVKERTLEVARNSNEQKRLWDLARALRADLAKKPIDADYAIACDVGLDAERNRGYVHVVVAAQNGDCVFAEMVNDQSPLFASRPKTLVDCEAIAVALLRQRVR
ncbi:MAG: hypothetical protein U1E73_05935 [Planctomycetota bacterium]